MSNRRMAIDGMKRSLKGKATQVKGLAKGTIGKLAGNEQLKLEGKLDEVKGVIQEAAGKVEQKLARKL